jgi:hypothetical protein
MAVDRRGLVRAPPPAPPARCGDARLRRAGSPDASAYVLRSQAAVTEAHISRRELAAVAAALLLPIPLLAASGLRIPLPSAIERAAASLTPRLTQSGGFDGAVVDAAAPARPGPEPAEPTGAEPEGTASVAEVHDVSSTGIAPDTDVASPRNDDRDETTPAETDPPKLPPDPHTDDTTPPGGADGTPGVDTAGDAPKPALTAPPVDAAVETGVTIDAEAAGASAQVAVTDGGVAVDTGAAADVGPPLVVPLAPPTPLP